MQRHNEREPLMVPKSEKQLLSIVTSLISELLYRRFERPVGRGVDSGFRSLIGSLIDDVRSFVWDDGGVRVVRMLLVSFLNLITARVSNPKSDIKRDIQSPRWILNSLSCSLTLTFPYLVSSL